MGVSRDSFGDGSGGGGALYQTQDGTGEWQTRAQDPPPPGSRFVLCSPEGPARGVLLDPCEVDSLPMAVARSGVNWHLQAANHSRLGDVTAMLAAGDSLPALVTGDVLSIHYTVSPADSQAQDWVVVMSRTAGGSQARAKLRLGETSRIPSAFVLYQNQPNPFEATTTFRFDLPRPESVRLEVFDVAGRRVARVRDAWMPAGQHSLKWSRDANGAPVRPGTYLYRLSAGSFRAQKKLVVLP